MITTRSKFYYGHVIDESNRYLNFIETGGELTASLNPGNYSLTTFLIEIVRAMEAVGAYTYTATVNRSTRLITISSVTGNFTLLGSTGTNSDIGPWSLMGFDSSDVSGSNTYTGSSASGSVFLPQFPFMDYVSTQDNQEAVEATVNKSGSGRVEVVRYGVQKFMECEIDYITSVDCGSGSLIEHNPDGYSDAVSFMQYLISKALVEFIPDRDDPTTFETFILEKTESNSQGIGYKLREKIGEGLGGFYSSGRLTFRLIED